MEIFGIFENLFATRIEINCIFAVVFQFLFVIGNIISNYSLLEQDVFYQRNDFDGSLFSFTKSAIFSAPLYYRTYIAFH